MGDKIVPVPIEKSETEWESACDEGGLDVDATVQGLVAAGCDGQVVEGRHDPVL